MQASDSMKRLCTFLHLSDLHIGEFDEKSLDSLVPGISRWGADTSGMLGHEFKALRALERLFNKLRAEEGAKLIVTGDLTAKGHVDEFSAVTDLIGGIWDHGGREVSLLERDWKDRAIPGNHDHWPGKNTILGKETPSFGATFKSRPFVGEMLRISTRHWLRFVCIDTDSGVGPHGLNRFLARGAFCDQLDEARRLLPLAEEGEVRVLLLHHSFCHNELALGITKPSRRALEEFLVAENISVLLTGHLHVPKLKMVEVKGAGGLSMWIFEARCGTSSQRTTLPATFRNVAGRLPKIRRQSPNTVIVHRVYENTVGNLLWMSEVLVQTGFGFRKVVDDYRLGRLNMVVPGLPRPARLYQPVES